MAEVRGVGAVVINSVTGESVSADWLALAEYKSSVRSELNSIKSDLNSIRSDLNNKIDSIGSGTDSGSTVGTVTVVGGEGADLSSLNSSIVALSNSISSLGDDLVDLNDTVQSLWSWHEEEISVVSAIRSSVTVLGSGVDSIKDDCGEIKSSMAAIGDRLANLETVVDGLDSPVYETISVGSDSGVTIQYDDSTIKGNIALISSDVSSIMSSIGSIGSSMSGLGNSIQGDHNSITLFGSSINNFNERIGSLESNVEMVGGRVGSLENDITITPGRTDLTTLSVSRSSGGTTLMNNTSIGATPLKFQMTHDSKTFTFMGTWHSDGTKGSGLFTAEDNGGDYRVYMIRRNGTGLDLYKIYPFEGNLGDLDPEQTQVIKVFLKALLDNRSRLDSEKILDKGVKAAVENTSWSIRSWEGLINAFCGDVESYLLEGKSADTILLELCGIDFTNEDVGAVGGIDAGGDEILDKYSVVPEDPEEEDYEEEIVPITLSGETVEFIGRKIDGVYFVRPPTTDTLYSGFTNAQGTLIGRNYTMSSENQEFYRKFLRYQLPGILKRIKEGFGLSWADQERGPRMVPVCARNGTAVYGDPGDKRVIPVYISDEPRASGQYHDIAQKDEEGLLAYTRSYYDPNYNPEYHSGAASCIIIPKSNIAYMTSNPEDLDGLREAAATRKFVDRTLVHEMVHAIMFCNIPYLTNYGGNICRYQSINGLPSLAFSEGIAELICGADDTRTENIRACITDGSLKRYLTERINSVLVYSAGYCLLRYFTKQTAEKKRGDN